jgi:hypothetical protein
MSDNNIASQDKRQRTNREVMPDLWLRMAALEMEIAEMRKAQRTYIKRVMAEPDPETGVIYSVHVKAMRDELIQVRNELADCARMPNQLRLGIGQN